MIAQNFSFNQSLERKTECNFTKIKFRIFITLNYAECKCSEKFSFIKSKCTHAKLLRNSIRARFVLNILRIFRLDFRLDVPVIGYFYLFLSKQRYQIYKTNIVLYNIKYKYINPFPFH